jgi:hypothetical protein
MRYIAAVILSLAASAAFGETHPCEADALAQAGPLLKLHFNDEGSVLAKNPGEPDGSDAQAWSLDDHATVLKPVKALVGAGKFDVLEVNGYVYRATYRMHFIYAQVPGDCLLMGQEILEMSDPY